MSVPREWICLQAAVAFRLAPRRARLRQQSCRPCSRCIIRDALPRDFARINLLQWLSEQGSATKPFLFAHETELKQSRVVARSKRANEVALPVAADSKAAYAAGDGRAVRIEGNC